MGLPQPHARFIWLPVYGSRRLFGRLFDRLYNGRGANGTDLVALLRNHLYGPVLCLVTRSFPAPPSATRLARRRSECV